MPSSRRMFCQLFGMATGLKMASALRLGTSFSESPAAQGDGFIRLDRNENPYGPSPKVIDAVQRSINQASRYTRVEQRDALADAIARFHRVDREQVLLGAGSTDLLRMAAQAFLGPKRRLIVADPTFDALEYYARFAAAQAIKVPLTRDLTHDLTSMRARIGPATGLVYLCNPNNPTGTLTPRKQIEQFVVSLPATTAAVVDEAYHHYANASSRYVSFLDQPVANDRVIVMRTFSKIYALAGLRLGYAVADRRLVAKMKSYLTDIDLNSAAVAAGRAALADTESVRNSVKRNTDDRQEFFNQAMARMLKPIDSQTNFVMMDVRQPADAIIEHFQKNKIRIGRHFPPLNSHIRISLGTPPAMQEFWRVWDLLPHSKMSM